ncbi:MAG: ATP-binding protein [Alphaproteobacteria bacterium]|nr:ATP-binding protein [Alphaproteobacteria bacterium]
MATADHVKALIRSHSEGDNERFYAVALQVAAQAARQGHTKFAQELRDLVDRSKVRGEAPAPGQRTKPIPIVQPRGELAGLLSAAFPTIRLADMALDRQVRTRLERILLEQRQREELRAHGMSPIRKLLLIGPPGTGKTMTASALAGELGVPLFTIQLDGLITRYLGETAAKLRLIFEAIQQTRAVYFFDEFDALGSERATKNEVGEIRRVLNSFLQFLEQDDSDSIVAGATNHPQILDRALFRRFDSVIEYSLPSPDISEQVMRDRLALLDTSQVNWPNVVEAAKGLCHSDLTRACERAAKNAILQRHTCVDSQEFVEALQERRATHR